MQIPEDAIIAAILQNKPQRKVQYGPPIPTSPELRAEYERHHKVTEDVTERRRALVEQLQALGREIDVESTRWRNTVAHLTGLDADTLDLRFDEDGSAYRMAIQPADDPEKPEGPPQVSPDGHVYGEWRPLPANLAARVHEANAEFDATIDRLNERQAAVDADAAAWKERAQTLSTEIRRDAREQLGLKDACFTIDPRTAQYAVAIKHPHDVTH